MQRMLATLALIVRVASVITLLAACVTWCAIGLPEYGAWKITGLRYTTWVRISDLIGFASIFCVIACAVTAFAHGRGHKRAGMLRCACASIAALILIAACPALSLVERNPAPAEPTDAMDSR